MPRIFCLFAESVSQLWPQRRVLRLTDRALDKPDAETFNTLTMTLFPQNSPARKAVRSTRGFTLLEILVVLAIIGLLVSLAVTNIDKIFGDAKRSTAEVFVKQSMKVPLTAYRMHIGDYPTTTEGLQALITPPATRADRWRGPYLQDGKMPVDPWGRPYQYRYPGAHSKDTYELFSYGPDGQESDDDVRSW